MKKLNGFFLVVFLFFSSFYFGTPALERYFHVSSSEEAQTILRTGDASGTMGTGEAWLNKKQKRFKRPKYVSEKFLIVSPNQAVRLSACFFFALILLTPVFFRIPLCAHLRAPPVPVRLA